MDAFAKIGKTVLAGLCGAGGDAPLHDDQALSTENFSDFAVGAKGATEAPRRMHSFIRFFAQAKTVEDRQDIEDLIEEAENAGIEFVSIECPNLSFNKATGQVATWDDRGETVMTFKLDDLPRRGYENFGIDENGWLSFESRGKTLHVKGRMEKGDILDGGLYMARPDGDGVYIAVEGGNRIFLGAGIEILALSSPVTMPHGTLMSGIFSISLNEQPCDFAKSGYLNGEYVAKDGTKFKGNRYFRLAMACKGFVGDCVVYHPGGDMLIDASYSDIDVEIPDGLYKNVIVGRMNRFDNKNHVNLTVKRQNDTTVKFAFSGEPPVSDGNLEGIETNIVHLYRNTTTSSHHAATSLRGYLPWMIYNGRPVGETAEGMKQTALSRLLGLRKSAVESDDEHGAESAEQIRLLLKAGAIAELDDLIHALGAREGDFEFQFELLNNSYLYPSIQDQIFWDDERKDIAKRTIYLSVTDAKSNLLLLNAKWAISEDREGLQLKIIEKSGFVTNPIEAMSLAESDAVREAILRKRFRFKKVSALNSHIEHEPLREFLAFVFSRPYDEQQRLLAQMDLGSDGSTTYRDIVLDESYTMRLIWETAMAKSPSSMETILPKLLPIPRVGFDPKEFVMTYRSPAFQARIEHLEENSLYLISPASRFSIALATVRLMDKYYGSIMETKIADMADVVIRSREAMSNRVLFGKGVQVIPVFHIDDMFDEDAFYNLVEDCGVDPSAGDSTMVRGLKPKYDKDKNRRALSVREVKERTLKAISEGSGRTTIVFNNHGGKRHQWLSDGDVGHCDSLDMHTSRAISFVELGDALMRRGNLGEITIVFDSCYSYDFARRLYKYLADSGATDMPVVITETNMGQLGAHDDRLKANSAYSQDSAFLWALEYAHADGEPITVGDVIASERYSFKYQDLVVFSSLTPEMKRELEGKGYEFIEVMDEEEDEAQADVIEVN